MKRIIIPIIMMLLMTVNVFASEGVEITVSVNTPSEREITGNGPLPEKTRVEVKGEFGQIHGANVDSRRSSGLHPLGWNSQ